MISLFKSTDTETTENDEIVNEVKTFYEQLYKSRDENLDDINISLSPDKPRLSNDGNKNKRIYHIIMKKPERC